MEKVRQIWYDSFNNKSGVYINKTGVNLIDADDHPGGTMTIAVCDDEKVCRDLLSGYIKECMAVYDYCDMSIDSYDCGEMLLEAYNAGKRYDIIFLDIKMKELSGFSTAKSIRTHDNNAMIIFVTSLADYIFNSFEYKPFWFLIKPVTEEKFRHVFTKAVSEIKNSKTREYSFSTREHGLLSIDINKILYIESFLRRIIIYTGNEQYTNYASITAEEEKLKKYDFIRIHKGYLVNMVHIQRINKYNVILKNNVALPLSEHRFKTVFDSFTSYLARCSL